MIKLKEGRIQDRNKFIQDLENQFQVKGDKEEEGLVFSIPTRKFINRIPSEFSEFDKVIITVGDNSWYFIFGNYGFTHLPFTKVFGEDILDKFINKLWNKEEFIDVARNKKYGNIRMSYRASDLSGNSINSGFVYTFNEFSNLAVSINLASNRIRLFLNADGNSKTVSPFKYGISSLWDIMRIIEDEIFSYKLFKETLIPLINDFDLATIKPQYILVKDLPKEKKIEKAKLKPISQELRDMFTDYLIDNYRNNLQENDVGSILNDLVEKDINNEVPKVLRHCISFDFTYTYFKEELGINIFDIPTQQCIRYFKNETWVNGLSPTDGKFIINKNVLNKVKLCDNLMILDFWWYSNKSMFNTIVLDRDIKWGSKEWEITRFPDLCLVIIPNTIKVNIEDLIRQIRKSPIYFGFEPITNENGEEIIPVAGTKKQLDFIRTSIIPIKYEDYR